MMEPLPARDLTPKSLVERKNATTATKVVTMQENADQDAEIRAQDQGRHAGETTETDLTQGTEVVEMTKEGSRRQDTEEEVLTETIVIGMFLPRDVITETIGTVVPPLADDPQKRNHAVSLKVS